jgi:hypothetical protein
MIKVRKNPWRLAKKTLLIVACVIVLSGLVGALVLYMNRDTNPVPSELRSALTFSPLVVPTTNETITTSDYRLTRGEDDTQILSYTIMFEDTEVLFSSYIQPPQFEEIPEYRERFLTNIVMQNATVPTANGTIYLGQLSNQDNQQIGVMLEYGLLVFMQPGESLDEATWRQIGESFVVARNS